MAININSGDKILMTCSGAGGGGGSGSGGTSGSAGSSGSVFIQTGTTTSSNFSFTPPVQLSEKEQAKLQQLRKDKINWLKQEKLNNFKKLPAHLRQEIVDEANIKDFVNSIANIDKAGFPDQVEIDTLESKSNSHSTLNGTWVGVDGFNTTLHMPSKYQTIINEFTKEELGSAHAEATLEEALEQ